MCCCNLRPERLHTGVPFRGQDVAFTVRCMAIGTLVHFLVQAKRMLSQHSRQQQAARNMQPTISYARTYSSGMHAITNTISCSIGSSQALQTFWAEYGSRPTHPHPHQSQYLIRPSQPHVATLLVSMGCQATPQHTPSCALMVRTTCGRNVQGTRQVPCQQVPYENAALDAPSPALHVHAV
jgi:hypothetical protein